MLLQEMMNIHNLTENSTLSISSPHIKDCSEVADYFKQCKISCHVSPNWSVVCNDVKQDQYDVETGCQIKFGNHSPYLINTLFFNKLKHRFGLTCAHLEVEGKFKGCIYNYFQPTRCPNT